MQTTPHLNYIAGEWTTGASVALNINPSDTRDVVGEYVRADAQQTQTAIDAAFDAQQTWAGFTAEQRA
uniref:aldehyde dehydrogenase family protein n=1 Tax=Stenotrophomonas sp. YIM B06876 TaxID=3060211 RepID=UPI002739B09A